MRAAEPAEFFQLPPRLLPEKSVDRVKDRAGMRLHCHPVFGPETLKIKRCHQRRERGGRGLMPADFHLVHLGPERIRVVNGPGRKPQNLALEFG